MNPSLKSSTATILPLEGAAEQELLTLACLCGFRLRITSGFVRNLTDFIDFFPWRWQIPRRRMVQEVSCLGREVDDLEAEVLLELLENQKTQVLGGQRRQNQSWFQSAGGRTCSAVSQPSKDQGIEEQGKVYWHPQ